MTNAIRLDAKRNTKEKTGLLDQWFVLGLVVVIVCSVIGALGALNFIQFISPILAVLSTLGQTAPSNA